MIRSCRSSTNIKHLEFLSQVKCKKKKESKCRNGGEMVLDLSGGHGSDPYKCDCPKNFTGKFCEIGENC